MSEIADMILEGEQCSHCGVVFLEEHGFPVLCEDCFKEETKEERAGLPKATND